MNTRTYLTHVFGFIIGALFITLFGYKTLPITSTTQFWIESAIVMGLGIAYGFCKFPVKLLVAGATSLLMGSLIQPVVSSVGGGVVDSAILITAAVTGTMGFLGFIYPDFFRKLGTALMISLFILIGYGILGSIFGFINMTFYSWIAVIIFTLYIGYDVSVALEMPKNKETALDVAFALYLNIINLFLNILRLLGNDD